MAYATVIIGFPTTLNEHPGILEAPRSMNGESKMKALISLKIK